MGKFGLHGAVCYHVAKEIGDELGDLSTTVNVHDEGRDYPDAEGSDIDLSDVEDGSNHDGGPNVKRVVRKVVF
jgi:hypothetical protein